MNTKNSKKILSTTVFAAIIVLLAFSVMSTTVSARVYTTLFPVEGDLGDVVDVTINVTVGAGQRVNVVDTLPAEFTYTGNFMVDGEKADPTVDEQVISYNIINPGSTSVPYEIEFNVNVTKAYAWKVENVTNVVNATSTDASTEEATADFNINKFTNLYEKRVTGPTAPVIEVEENWKIEMGVVKNPFDFAMEDTKITENFAGNLKIDNITVNKTTYTFEYNDTNYGTKEANVTITIRKDGKVVGDRVYPLDKVGVTTPDGSRIYWTGRTHTAHVVWDIGNLDPVNIGPNMVTPNVAEITIGVSTDKNPTGKQLYGSTGIYYLNSGATLTFNDRDMMQLSAVTAPIEVEAVSAP